MGDGVGAWGAGPQAHVVVLPHMAGGGPRRTLWHVRVRVHTPWGHVYVGSIVEISVAEMETGTHTPHPPFWACKRYTGTIGPWPRWVQHAGMIGAMDKGYTHPL